MSLIRLHNLSFSYRTASGEPVPVLKNLNLEIAAGELVAIQGPSGSGKSTLLYIIGCLLNSYSGLLEIGEKDISKLNDTQLAVLRNRSIGFVFQQFHLLPKATVLENILLPSQYPAELPNHRDATKRAGKLVDDLGLSDRTHHYPNQLSGGQQQRVSVARALLSDTQIILADEPTGSLDTQNSKQIMELLKSANRSGRTVIIITHDPEIAQQCDKIVQFRDGEIKNVLFNPNSSLPKVGFGANNSDHRMDTAPTENRVERESRDKDSKLIRSPDDLNLQQATPPNDRISIITRYLRVGVSLLPLAFQSLKQNRSRSLLTMLGIVIGVAAVLAMMTIGSFTKRKILESYAEMGVNTFVFYGYPNWDLRATDQVSVIT